MIEMVTDPTDSPDTADGTVPPPQRPSRGPARSRALAGRALTRRCPYCGGIFDGWWTLRDHCPSCGVSYEQEEGYFLGAYALDLLFDPPGAKPERRLRGHEMGRPTDRASSKPRAA